MTKKINFAFSIGYIAGLENKLISKYNLNKLKKCETVEEFFSKLKTLKYKEINFKDYETFEAKINENFEKTIEELRKICPEKEEFEYVFCKNNFLNFKIFLKHKFSNISLNNLTAKPFSINPKKIEICLKNNSFEEINETYRKSFKKILEKFKKTENKKQAEILIDKEMYNVLLKISKNNIFLKNLTQLEITLKNINFAIRFLKNKNNIKCLEEYLLENKNNKEEILNFAKKGLDELCKIFEKFNVKDSNLKLKQNFNCLEEICENILEDFKEHHTEYFFSFNNILIFIEKLKKENKILKETLLQIQFKN